jgi:hypothetical protein
VPTQIERVRWGSFDSLNIGSLRRQCIGDARVPKPEISASLRELRSRANEARMVIAKQKRPAGIFQQGALN